MIVFIFLEGIAVADIYKIMFAVGILYTLASLIISGISGALHFGAQHIGHIDGGGLDGHAHVQGHMHHHGDAGHVGGDADLDAHVSGASHGIMSFFLIIINPLVAISFLTVFGGLGLLGTLLNWNGLLVFLGSILLAVAIAIILYRYVALPLYRSENSSHVSRADLIGKRAVVVSPVLKNGFGEIRYTINDTRYNAPAREIDDQAVEQGEEVIICRVEENIFYISRMENI